MKSKVGLTILLSCTLIGIAASLYVQATAPVVSQSFTLAVTGQACNRKTHQYVNVHLAITGTADGKLTKILHMHVRGGSLQVQNFGTFSVSRGSGTVVQTNHYIVLNFKISSLYYGGQVGHWHLHGTTGIIDNGDLPVSFYSRWVAIPISGSPRLYNLSLVGTLTAN